MVCACRQPNGRKTVRSKHLHLHTLLISYVTKVTENEKGAERAGNDSVRLGSHEDSSSGYLLMEAHWQEAMSCSDIDLLLDIDKHHRSSPH